MKKYLDVGAHHLNFAQLFKEFYFLLGSTLSVHVQRRLLNANYQFLYFCILRVQIRLEI